MKTYIKLSALSWLLAFIIALGVWTLGFLCRDLIPGANWISLVIIFLIPAAFFVNLFGTKRFLRKLNSMPMAQRLEMVTLKQKDAENDIEAVLQKRHKTCQKVKVYIISIVVLTLLMCFMCGAASKVHTPVVQLLLAMYIIKDTLCRLFLMNRFEDGEDYISEEDYPVIYSLARRAAAECGVKDEIKIYASAACTASIGTVGKRRCLYLGAVLLQLFSEDELYQTMLHEFGHVVDSSYSDYRTEAENLLRYMSCSNNSQQSILFSVFLQLPGSHLALENELVNTVCSAAAEKQADSTVLRCGKPVVFVSALAKLNTYGYFEDYSSNLPPFFEPEKPRGDVVDMLCSCYLSEYELHKEQWRYMLEHELPARLDSHPSFPQRREAMGGCDFTIEFSDPDTAYRREGRRLADYVNSLLEKQYSPEVYEEKRREAYLKPLSFIEEYEATEKEYSSEELSPLLNAYRELLMDEKAEALCDKIIAQEKNPYAAAHALFVKGLLLLKNYDAAGIDYLYKASELNENYKQSGMDEVGKFCLRMGLEEELQRYRDTMDSYVESGLDEYMEMGCLTEKDTIVPEKFPDDRLPEMLDFMTAAGEGAIEEIYLVRKVITDDCFTSIFTVRFAEGTAQELCSTAYERVFNYLDTYPDGWQYTLLVYDKPTAKILKKVPEALVYSKS